MSFKESDFVRKWDKVCDNCGFQFTLREHKTIKNDNGKLRWFPFESGSFTIHQCGPKKDYPDGLPVNEAKAMFTERKRADPVITRLPPESFPEEPDAIYDNKTKELTWKDKPVDVELKAKGKKVMCPLNRGMRCNEACALWINGVCAIRLIAIGLPGAGRGY